MTGSSRFLAVAVLLAGLSASSPISARAKGTQLEDLTWIEAEKLLTKETVVVIPIGAGAKEHGPHLKLKNDFIPAEYFKRRVLDAAEVLATQGILLRSTDILKAGKAAEDLVRKEPGGTHADEIETSMILHIDPSAVEMSKAVKDYNPGQGELTRDPNGTVTWSASGGFGDATLATRKKGEKVVEAMVRAMPEEIEDLRKAPLPPAP